MKDITIKEIKGFSSAYPNICDLKLLPNRDETWITIQDNVGTSLTIKLSDLSDFIHLNIKGEPKASVLDKIQAEMERHRRKTEAIDPYDLVGDCLDIIDKYREESEDKNEA